MSDRLTPQREAEIAARATSEHLTPGPWRLEYESCDCSDGYCRHGEYVTGVVTPLPTPIATERIARTGEKPRDYDFSRTEMGDFIDADWELMVHAREDVPALLAELAAVRAERDQAQARVAELENPKSRKRPTTKEEFSREGGRVVCRDCNWTSQWYDTTNQYGAFKSASIFHKCEDEEAAR